MSRLWLARKPISEKTIAENVMKWGLVGLEHWMGVGLRVGVSINERTSLQTMKGVCIWENKQPFQPSKQRGQIPRQR